MKKRMAAGIFAAIFLLLLAPCAAYALDMTPSDLTVIMEYGDTPLQGIHVAVCPVADASEQNGNIVFDAVPAFAGAGADFSNLTTEKNIALAASLDAYASANQIARDAKITNSDGEAYYAALPPGLYLVAQTNAADSGYEIAPYLVMLPNPTSTRDIWNYNVISYPKTEPVKLNIASVSVFKVWQGSSDHPGSVLVQLYQNGSPYGDPVTLNAENYWSCTWNDLSANVTWSVDELNVPASYIKTVSGSATNGFVITNTKTTDTTTTIIPHITPKTEDTSNMPLWIILIVASFIGLLVVVCILISKRVTHASKRK